MLLLALPLLAVLAAAQDEYLIMCECAVFNTLQFKVPNPVPLEYYGDLGASRDQCNVPVGNINKCMLKCQLEFDVAGGLELDMCSKTSNRSPRCVGSQWCEALHNSGISDVEQGDGISALYYRMVDCEGTPYYDWQYAFREVNDRDLCCQGGQFSSCITPCGDECSANNLCECGAFVKSQFDENLRNGTNPLPLQNIGTTWGAPGQVYCENWPGADFRHSCDTSCLIASQFFKAQIALQDTSSKNALISQGDYYCQALKARWDDQWPENGIGPEEIVTYARMPYCDRDDGTEDHLKWNTERRYTCHHQALCCDGDGNRVKCEGGVSKELF